MKDIIILGTARSGKTTFAEQISKDYNYTIISIDSFVEAFQVAFPNLGIYHKNTEFKFKNLPKFIASYYTKIKKEYPNRNFIIEGWHVFPDELFKYLNKDDFVVACLGYPNQNAEDKLKLLRQYTYTNDYCKYISDKDLLETVCHQIEYAKQMKKQCENLSITYFDLSYDWVKTHNQLREYVSKLLK